jgi:hypothetical protein
MRCHHGKNRGGSKQQERRRKQDAAAHAARLEATQSAHP